MDDPYAVLRIPAFTVRKESDLPKLKQRATNLVRQYEKVNKFDKAREVEKAYRQVKEMVVKRANCAGSKAFNKVMVNRPEKPKAEPKPKAVNPAEAHFLKAQGSAKAPPAPPVAPRKSREERLKEKLEARRAAASEKDKRAAAIREKLAAKRARKGTEEGAAAGAEAGAEAGEAGQGASPLEFAASPEESLASPPENMASPDSEAASAHGPTDNGSGEEDADNGEPAADVDYF
ncbi:unnamed protein product [Effrenium voratum]|uniref:Uncharacterized protein n=1 Tax=Effrenium voratum TaxID=2562239 RepID=A0AA36I3G7_9DINO|nr:unnamed protein product [Effrenium voratum]CAJ1414173.1 unnamed protein product [Effrenium voratum]